MPYLHSQSAIVVVALVAVTFAALVAVFDDDVVTVVAPLAVVRYQYHGRRHQYC